MKKLAATMAGLAVAGGTAMWSGAALADGMLAKKAPPPEVVVPAYSWGGLYVGAHVGAVWGDIDWRVARTPFPEEADEAALPNGTRVSHEISDFIGGGQIGIQHQFGRWVLGLEASLSGGQDLTDKTTLVKTSIDEGDEVQHDIARLRTDMDWLILATARLGYTWDRWMLYAKGGYASARLKLSGTRQQFEDSFDELEKNDVFRSSERHHGWTIGAGVEYMLMPNVTLGLEYNFIDLNAKTHSGVATLRECVEDTNCQGANVETELRRFNINVNPDEIHTVWARLNFKLSRELLAEPLK